MTSSNFKLLFSLKIQKKILNTCILMKLKMFYAFHEKVSAKIIKNSAFFLIGTQGTFVNSIIAMSKSIQTYI